MRRLIKRFDPIPPVIGREKALAGWRLMDHRQCNRLAPLSLPITAFVLGRAYGAGPVIPLPIICGSGYYYPPLMLALYCHNALAQISLPGLVQSGHYTAFATGKQILAIQIRWPLAALPAMVAKTGVVESLFSVSRDYRLFARAAAPQAR